MKRGQSIRVYNQLYSALPVLSIVDRDRCFYCGEESACFDHQPPITRFADMVDSGEPFEAVLIPSCNHCNSLLSDSPTKTLSERFMLLKKKVSTKYRKQLQAVGKWKPEDLSELGEGLRGMVEASIQVGMYAQSVLEYPGHKLKDTDTWIDPFDVVKCEKCGVIHSEPVCPSCNLPI